MTKTGRQSANIPERASAGSLDAFILILCWFGFHSYYISAEGSDMNVIFVVDRTFPLFFVLYFTIFEWLWGRTPGKWVFGLRVYRENKTIPDFKISALRNVLKFFSIFIIFAGYLIVLFRKDNLTFHDLLTHCIVIKNKK